MAFFKGGNILRQYLTFVAQGGKELMAGFLLQALCSGISSVNPMPELKKVIDYLCVIF